jgi:hypothetical protein
VCETSFISTRLLSTKRISITLTLTCATLIVAFGQVLQTKRLELPLFDHSEKFQIISAAGSGLFLHRAIQIGKINQLQLIKLDTALTQQWSGFLPIEPGYSLSSKLVKGDFLYLLMRYQDFTKNDFLLYRIHESTGDFSREFIKSFIPFNPTDFQITEGAALIGGYFNRVPVVMHYSLSTLKSKVLPGMFNDIGELTQVRVHNDGSFDVLISSLTPLKQRTLWIKSYTSEGELLRNIALDPEENKHLIFGRSLKTEQNLQLVAGVYGTRSAEYSRGIFITNLDPSGMQQTKYYNFADLKNFFKYMRSGREHRIKQRIERKKIKGKRIRFNYRFLVHEVIPYKDQYVLLGEAFYPKYITVNQGPYSFFTPRISPGAFISNGRIFDGYYYTHAVVMGFDRNGNLLWDNSFEINDVRTFTLEQFVKLEVQDDRIALVYLFENELRTKIIQGDQVIEGKSNDVIKGLNGQEIVRKQKGAESKLEYWYDDFLYAYGVQDVVNPFRQNEPRKVFYINKITYPDN